MTEVIFHPAELEDIERVLHLIRAYYKFDAIPFRPAELTCALDGLLRNPALGRVWLFRCQREDAGYAVLTFGYDLEFGGPVATVTELYIAPAFRREGLGTQALRFMENVCGELGISALELQVEKDNTQARAFYRKLGFREHTRIPLSKEIRPASQRNRDSGSAP